jgi:hypothetical protein
MDITVGDDFLGLGDQKKFTYTCVQFRVVTELWSLETWNKR